VKLSATCAVHFFLNVSVLAISNQGMYDVNITLCTFYTITGYEQISQTVFCVMIHMLD
jgi:hypothetical protein